VPETRKLQRPVSPTATRDADDQPRGNCYGTDDPELWFSNEFQDQALAALICSTCPVRNECAAAALERREEYGVFGGMTAEDRRKALKPKPKPKHAPPVRSKNTHCRLGLHELDEANTRYTAHGTRYCGPCDAARRRRNHAAATTPPPKPRS